MCALVFFNIKAYAAVVSDEFDTLHEKLWNKYHNLSISNTGISIDYGWDNPPDNTALMISAPQAVSTALYAVAGAQTAEIAIYSAYSTAAAMRDREYYLGLLLRSDEKTLMRTRINPSGNAIYLEENQGWKKAFLLDDNKIKFIPTLTPPLFLGKGENYGLTMLASADNEKFAEVPLTISKVMNSRLDGSSSLCFYEKYSGVIPENTKFIKLELRETRGFEKLTGEFIENSQVGSLRFAKAEFTGAEVKWGSFSQPEPSEPPEPPETSKPTEPSSSSSGSADGTSSNGESSAGGSNDSGSQEETSSSEESSSPDDSTSQEESTSPDEASSGEEASSESDALDSGSDSSWTTDAGTDDPDLQKPIVRPAKPAKPSKIEVIEEKLTEASKKSSVKAASKVSNKSSSKASSKAPVKESSKSTKPEAPAAQPSSAEPKAGGGAPSVKVVQPSPERNIAEEKRMVVAGTYIAGASFVLAGLIRKP